MPEFSTATATAVSIAQSLLVMEKEKGLLPIRRKDLSGIIAKEPESVFVLTENLPMMVKPIFRYWKIISAPILPIGMKV